MDGTLLDKEEAFGKKRSEGEETDQEEVAVVERGVMNVLHAIANPFGHLANLAYDKIKNGKKRSEGEETGQEEVASVDRRWHGEKEMKKLGKVLSGSWNNLGKKIDNALGFGRRSEGEETDQEEVAVVERGERGEETFLATQCDFGRGGC